MSTYCRKRDEVTLTSGNGSPITWQNMEVFSPGLRDWILGVTLTSGSALNEKKNANEYNN